MTIEGIEPEFQKELFELGYDERLRLEAEGYPESAARMMGFLAYQKVAEPIEQAWAEIRQRLEESDRIAAKEVR